MTGRTQLAIVVPFLNEEGKIPAFCSSLLSTVRTAARPGQVSVVFVDNGSTDHSVDVLSKAASGLEDVAIVRLVTAPRHGAGNARRAGVDAALALMTGAESSTPRHWILSTDIDCVFPASFIETWLIAIGRTRRHLLAGAFRFDTSAWADYPVSHEIYLRETSVRATLEAAFGVVNPAGANFAIGADAYVKIGGFRQPTLGGSDVPAAGGEDWDVGERARSAGLRAGSASVTLTTSARRLRRSPKAFVTGCSYFRDVGGRSDPGADVTRGERKIVAGIARHHTLMHWGCKPFLVDETVRRHVLAALSATEAKRINAWLGAKLGSLSSTLSTELYRVLGGFCREFGTVLLNLADMGARFTPACDDERTARVCEEEL